MALNTEEIELLKRQGLEADIRNNLGNMATIPALLDGYETEQDPNKKQELFLLLKSSISQLTNNVNHICDSLSYYDLVEKTSQ